MLFKYGLLKYLGLTLSVVFGILQPTIFEDNLNQDNFSFLLLLYGFATYLILFDLGINRTVYAKLRKLYIENDMEWKTEILYTIPLFNLMLLSILVLFSIILLCFWALYLNSFNYITIMLFVITIVINIGINYMEVLYNGINKLDHFQYIDLSRKFINISALFLAYIDNSMLLTFLYSSLGLFILLAYLQYSICRLYVKRKLIILTGLDSIINTFKKYWKDARDIFFFNINETLLYNNGYILVPFYFGSLYIIQYGLWMKLFLGITIVSGGVTSIFIHKITETYFNGNYKQTKNYFFLSLILSVIISLFCFSIFYKFSDLIIKYWVSEIYSMDKYLIYSLGLWTVANSIQNVSGVFLLSIGGQFKYMRNLSSVIVIAIIVTTIVCLSVGYNLGELLLILGCEYIFGMFFYLNRSVKILFSNS